MLERIGTRNEIGDIRLGARGGIDVFDGTGQLVELRLNEVAIGFG